MMRIAVKWCQELKEKYDNTKERKEQFRMVDGKEQFLDGKQHAGLHKALQK